MNGIFAILNNIQRRTERFKIPTILNMLQWIILMERGGLYFSAYVMFMQDTTTEFNNMIDETYKETSLHLLDVLHEKYKFLDHLKVRSVIELGER